jgi:hypothetical protein
MLGISTYKDVAKWRDQWMLIMSPKSGSFRISALKPDVRTVVAIKEAGLRQPTREMVHSGSQEPRQSGSTVENKPSYEAQPTGIETDVWED